MINYEVTTILLCKSESFMVRDKCFKDTFVLWAMGLRFTRQPDGHYYTTSESLRTTNKSVVSDFLEFYFHIFKIPFHE